MSTLQNSAAEWTCGHVAGAVCSECYQLLARTAARLANEKAWLTEERERLTRENEELRRERDAAAELIRMSDE